VYPVINTFIDKPVCKKLSFTDRVLDFNLSFFDKTGVFQEAMAQLLEWLAAGTIHPLGTMPLPFDQVTEAHHMLESGQSKGKIVLVLGPGAR